MSPKATKEITIEDLAVMVQNGFSDLEQRLTERMDKRFEDVDKHLNRLDRNMLDLSDQFFTFRIETTKNFERLGVRTERVEEKIDKHDHRIGKLEKKLV